MVVGTGPWSDAGVEERRQDTGGEGRIWCERYLGVFNAGELEVFQATLRILQTLQELSWDVGFQYVRVCFIARVGD